MILIILILQSLQYLDSLLLRRFLDVYLLESAGNTLALRHIAVVLLVSSRADKADVTSLQILLEHIGSIQTAIRTTSGTNDIMNLINIDDDITFIGSTSHDQLDAFLKITTILGTSQHLSDVHAVDAGTFQTIRHLIFIDKFGKPIDQSRLSYSRFTNMQRIILLCTAKHLDGTIQFLLSSDERIMFIHLSGDTSYKLVPVIRHITPFFVIIIIILIVHFI